MRKLLTLDGRDEVSVGVSLQEAQAIERWLVERIDLFARQAVVERQPAIGAFVATPDR